MERNGPLPVSYLFDFLGLGEEAHERDIQDALIRHITRFLLELGAGFAFVGRPFRLEVGEAAGQTVPHLHLHRIPRFDGDVDDPTGGVRFVIPSRGNYRKPGFVPQLVAVSEGEPLTRTASEERA